MELEKLKIEEEKKQLESQRAQILKEQQNFNKERSKLVEWRQQLQKQQTDLLKKEQEQTRISRQMQELQVEINKQLLEARQVSGQNVQSAVHVISGRVGNLSEFDTKDDWSIWSERFEQYLTVNDITDEDKKKSLFLTLLGSEAYALLKNLCIPNLPSSKTCEQLKTIMKNHLQPAPSTITERYKFKECKQEDNQDIKEFIAKLKKLSMYCDFGNNLEDNLRDQLVWGLKSQAMKKRLLGETNLTYTKAIELATALETATKDVLRMSSSTDKEESLHSINNNNSKNKNNGNFKQRRFNQRSASHNLSTMKCYCCGKTNHRAADCRYKHLKCHICNMLGHLAPTCRNRFKMQQNVATKKDNYQNDNRNFRNFKKYDNKHNFIDDVTPKVDDDREDLEQLFFLKPIENAEGSNQNIECDNIYDSDYSVEFENLFYCDKSNDITSNDKEEVKDEPMLITLNVEGMNIEFELDTGSSISAISEKIYNEYEVFHTLKLEKTNRRFKPYQGDIMIPLGTLMVKVRHNGRVNELKLFVFPGVSRPIIGRVWMRVFNLIKLEESDLTFNQINHIEDRNVAIKNLTDEFNDVFTDKLGKYTKRKVKLVLKSDVKPIFHRPRPVPYALRVSIEQEINRLIRDNILTPVTDSDWATPIVPVFKKNGQIRICGDYRITLNPNLEKNRHPIPRVQDLFSTISGGKVYSKIDLNSAYQQLELEDDSKLLVTISTHMGLFAYERLCFGVSPAPGIFQNEMESVLRGIEGVLVFFDDILIAGKNRSEHDIRLKLVLKRLRECELTVKLAKCELFKEEIEFLGYVLSKEGLKSSNKKVKAISEIPQPKNITELRAFLGALNYYSKFIKNYANVVGPLYKLLKNDSSWNWSNEQVNAFDQAKKCLLSHNVLVHYNPCLPIKVTCDASPVGLGAVLSHIFKNGEEKPIMYAARTLSTIEKKYSQLDREALALVFAVRYFHQYIYGRHFILETDHKPLTYIFGQKKGIPLMAASRLQRWAILLLAYDFTIKHIRGIDNKTADFLSRLVSSSKEKNDTEIEEFSYLNFVENESLTISSYKIKCETEHDLELKIILEFVRNGWPKNVDNKFLPYKNRSRELAIEGGCLMWGHRIIIPKMLREEMLKELHDAHLGMVRMKAIARSYFWWPGIDLDIENTARSCRLCLDSADNPPRSVLHVWKWPEGPNQRLHADFLGPINSQMFIVIVDAFSKWIDIRYMSDITSKSTIAILRNYFACWGLPYKLVTDNGPAFISQEFNEFLVKNGVMHIRTAPYHPASNGLAENAVKTFKKKFKILLKSGFTTEEALDKYLLCYRASPHLTTGISPAELQINRPVRTRLDLIRPSLRDEVENKQNDQKHYFHGNRTIEFEVNEPVMAKDYRSKVWRPATIVKRNSLVTYDVKTDNNLIWKRHIDQLKPYIKTDHVNDRFNEEEIMKKVVQTIPITINDESQTTDKRLRQNNETVNSSIKEQNVINGNNDKIVLDKRINKTRENNIPSQTTELLRRSTRIRNKPVKLNW